MCTYYVVVTISLISFIFYTQVIFLYETMFELYSMTPSLTLPLFTPPFSSERQELKNETTRSTKVFVKQNDTCGGWHVLSLPLPFTRTPQLHSHFIPFLFTFNEWNKGASEGRTWALRTRTTPWNTHTAPSTAPKSYHWGWDYAGWWRGEGEEEEEAEGETAGRPPLHSLGKAQAAAHLYRLEESRREGSEPGE